MHLHPIVRAAAAFLLIGGQGAALAAAGGAVPTAVAPALTDLPNGTLVAIPFAPPLGERVRYRVTKTKDGKPAGSGAYDYLFEEAGEGFRLTVRPVVDRSMPLVPPSVEKAYADALVELGSLPIVLSLAADGEVLKLENEKEYLAAYERMLGAAEDLVPADATAEHKAFAGTLLATIRSIPAETQAAILLEAVKPVLEFGGTEFPVGETAEVDAEVAAIEGAVLPRKVTVRLDKADGESALFSTVDTAAPEEFSTMMGAFLRKLDSAGGATMEAEFGVFKSASQQSRSTYRVSRRDGLLTSFTANEVTEIVASKGTTRRTEVLTMERIP